MALFSYQQKSLFPCVRGILKVQTKQGFCISSIKSDHGTKFENGEFHTLYESYRINHNFSPSITPQHNGVMKERTKPSKK